MLEKKDFETIEIENFPRGIPMDLIVVYRLPYVVDPRKAYAALASGTIVWLIMSNNNGSKTIINERRV